MKNIPKTNKTDTSIVAFVINRRESGKQRKPMTIYERNTTAASSTVRTNVAPKLLRGPFTAHCVTEA